VVLNAILMKTGGSLVFTRMCLNMENGLIEKWEMERKFKNKTLFN